jgi:peptidylprolyl isomerase/FKBP-type peptidyl-prolyl cis-trans isomerase SlpA
MKTPIIGIYMKNVKNGDKVHILCEAKLEDGTVCYQNDEESLLVFVVGQGKFFPAIENEMKGMKKGEKKTMTLGPKEAFGEHKQDLVVEAPKDEFRSDRTFKVGSRVKLETKSGEPVHGRILEIKDDVFTIDFNHPLAGRNVIFSVTIVSLEESQKPGK